MPMLPARNYVSEHTQFIKKLMEEKPDLPEKQREGRVTQPPYVYGLD